MEQRAVPVKKMTDNQVWDQVDKVIEEMYREYREVNELDILSLARKEPETQEIVRNWDVPMAIEVLD